MILWTRPAAVVGTSIEALSDSITINGSSTSTCAPDATKISMTSTSSASPISGIRTSDCANLYSCSSHQPRIRFFRIDPKFRDCVRYDIARDDLLVRKRTERRDRDEVTIDLEEPSQLLPRITAAEAVGAQYAVWARHVGSDLIRMQLDVIRRRNDGRVTRAEALCNERFSRRLSRMQHLPSLDIDAVPAQLIEAG